MCCLRVRFHMCSCVSFVIYCAVLYESVLRLCVYECVCLCVCVVCLCALFVSYCVML